MRKVFAITCHKLTNPLIHTVKYLSSFDDNIVIIHLDLKSQFDDFSFLQTENVIFLSSRLDLVWGGFSQILASLKLMEFTSQFQFDYFFLLSGDDVPMVSNSYMDEFLSDNYGMEFVHFQNYKNNIVLPEDRVKYCYTKYHYRRDNDFFHKVLVKLHKKFRFFFLNKKFIENQERFPVLYKGVNWIGITKNMVDFILNYIDKNPWYLDSFESSLCADEVFFHSIINTNFNAIFYFDNNSINNALRYIDWNSGPEYPKILNMNDLLNVKGGSPIFFARKVQDDINFDFLNELIK